MNTVEESNKTLLRIEQNDPKLKSLAIANQGHTTGHTSEACFWLHDGADLLRLGNAIANNTYLKSIELGESSDWTRDTTPLLEGIQRNTAINHLSLHDGIGIRVLDKFANIGSLTQLYNLGLIRCDLRGAIARSLAQAMKKCPNLNEIFMFNCKLDDASLKDIALGMRGMSCLQKLGLFNYSFNATNTIGMEGAEAMKNLLQDSNCILTNLYLNSAGFNSECIQVIVNGLRGNTKLDHLTLSGSGITIQAAEEIGSLLQNTSCNINHLDFGYCGMNDESVATIVRSLIGNTKLKNLRLAGNNIGTSSSESIITLMQDPSCNINILDLGSCGLKNEPAAKIVSSLIGNTKLESLVLSGNSIGRSGCESIATLLRDRNSNINEIKLSRCEIGDNCTDLLAQSLIGNNKLTCLDLAYNSSITESGWNAFSTILSNCSNHILQSFGSQVPTNLSTLLKLNLAVDMEPFFKLNTEDDERKPKALPYVIDWFDRRGRESQTRNEEVDSINARKLSAIYQFARAVPLKFVPSSSDITLLHKEAKDELDAKKIELERQIASKEAEIRSMVMAKEELEDKIKAKDEIIERRCGMSDSISSLTKKRKHGV